DHPVSRRDRAHRSRPDAGAPLQRRRRRDPDPASHALRPGDRRLELARVGEPGVPQPRLSQDRRRWHLPAVRALRRRRSDGADRAHREPHRRIVHGDLRGEGRGLQRAGRPARVLEMTIDGVATRVGPEAVVVTAERELSVLSSAVVGGGFARARAVLNVHVPKNFACADAEGTVAAAARRLGVPAPWVALLTGARTERAEIATAAADDVRALVVVTVVGWGAARAARQALETAVGRWLAEHASSPPERRAYPQGGHPQGGPGQ